VQLSEQAQQKAQSDQVKQIAQRFVQDHERMNQQLKQVAQQLGVQVPQTLPSMKQEELQIFSSLSGKEFDQHYVAHMNAMHAHDVAAFEGTSSLSQNAPVKQFATENLPTLQQHYQMVRQVAQGFGISTQGADATPAGAHLPGTVGGEGVAPTGTGVSNPANGAGGNTSADRPAPAK
jgi:putative membrane protein